MFKLSLNGESRTGRDDGREHGRGMSRGVGLESHGRLSSQVQKREVEVEVEVISKTQSHRHNVGRRHARQFFFSILSQ